MTRDAIIAELDRLGLEPRAVGRSDFAIDNPLREALVLTRHCSGGLILGHNQLTVERGVGKAGTRQEMRVVSKPFPTPWNNLESGILFALGRSLLVFCESGVDGGIFDRGVTDLFIQQIPAPNILSDPSSGVHQVFDRWAARVREFYYRP